MYVSICLCVFVSCIWYRGVPRSSWFSPDESLRAIWRREKREVSLLRGGGRPRTLLSSLCTDLAPPVYRAVCPVCCILFCCACHLCQSLLLPMGQQLTTPLRLTLGHWQDVLNRARNESVEIRKKKWWTLCFSEWSALNTGWPRDSTFDLTTILQVKTRVFQPGPRGYPDQVPYVVTWESLSRDPPPWVRPFLPHPLSGPRPTPLPSPVPLIPTPSAPPSTSSLLPLTEPRSPNPRPKAPTLLPNTQEDHLLLDPSPP